MGMSGVGIWRLLFVLRLQQLPEVRGQRVVLFEATAECHPELFATWADHPMSMLSILPRGHS
jgi:hypothetical protein